MRQFQAVSFLLLWAIAQPSSPVSRAEVRLEAHDGQTHFKLGDLIRLDLVFRDAAFPDVRAELPRNTSWVAAAGQLTVNTSDYGDIAEEVMITPRTGWFQWRGRSAHDYLVVAPLDATGVRVPVVLNQGYVFRTPGHYEVSMTTWRMGNKPVTTNSVGIDIAARSAEEEAALVRSLDATIANTRGKERQEAAERLAYLPGDDAARSKVHWLLSSHQHVATAMTEGLAATQNQALQLGLLKAAWVDPSHSPDGTLQSALKQAEAFARGQTEPGWTMASRPNNDAGSRELEAEYQADLERVIATLPERTGLVRRDTAYYLVEDNELSPNQLARVKPLVLEEFSRMEPIAQSMLIETRWNAVKDPSLAPALKAMIDSKSRDADAATAVERLVEIDGGEARPYVVEMICRTGSGLSLDKLSAVKQDRLPEVNSCLTSILNKGERREPDFDWEQAALRAARFATPAILPSVKPAWTNASQDPSMLALLARDAPDEAVALLEREPHIEWFPTNTVYQALGGKLPDQVLTWLRGPKAPASAAAFELAQFGAPQDRALLEKRLGDLRSRWRGHEAEMRAAQPGTPASLAKSEEAELVSALLSAKAWSMTADEKQRITNECISDECRLYAPHSIDR